jgi:hypothetical protein
MIEIMSSQFHHLKERNTSQKKQGLHEIKVLPTKSKIQATFIYQPTYIVKSSLLTERARKLQSFLHNNNWTPINHERREPG